MTSNNKLFVGVFGMALSFSTAQSMHNEDSLEDELYNYELFKIVQRVHDIVDKVIADSKEYETEYDSGKEAWPGSNPYWQQTKKGLFLLGGKELWTPWGEVMLTKGVSPFVLGRLAFRQQLLKNFETSFFCMKEGGRYRNRPKYYVLKSKKTDLRKICLGRRKVFLRKGKNCLKKKKTPVKLHNVFKEVSEEDLDEMKGEKNLLITSNCFCGYCPIYKVHAVEGQKLPEPDFFKMKYFRSNSWLHSFSLAVFGKTFSSFFFDEDYRGYKDVKLAWATMEKRFKEEQKSRTLKQEKQDQQLGKS